MATAFAEFGALRTIYEQLDLYEKIGYRIDKTRLAEVLRKKASRELRGAVSSELSWVLFGFLKFGLPIESPLLDEILVHGDDISRILAMRLAAEKHLGIKRRARTLVARLGPVNPNSEHWLLFWELYRNGWATDAGLKAALINEPIFHFLDQEGVSFLREPGVDLLEIPPAFEEQIEKIHGAGEAVRLEGEIKKTFADTAPEATAGLAKAEDEEEEEEGFDIGVWY
jgi:hypothetical protein